MNIKVYALLLSLLVLFPATAASTQEGLETYRLNYRDAAEIMPLVQPHLSEGATLSGMNQQLVLRGSSRDHELLTNLLSEFDRPPVNLMVSLRTGAHAEAQDRGGNAEGEIRPEGIGGRVRIYRSESARNNDAMRQVRVLEGGSARFDSRLHLPITNERAWQSRHGQGLARDTHFLILEEGFYVRPVLQGDRVLLDIAAGSFEGLEQQEVLTQVSGPLGEWLPLAASAEDGATGRKGLTLRSNSARQQGYQSWIMVEKLD